jgi:hypothetical protein
MRREFLMLVITMAACSSAKSVANEAGRDVSPSTPASKTDPKEAMRKIDAPLSPKLTVVDHPVSPKADALVWLQHAQTGGVEFKAPIEVTFTFQGVTACAVGLASDKIDVKVDDSRLGMGLAMRAEQFCKGATVCAMWVWANWRDGILIVNKVDSPISEQDRATATHFHVAK